MAGSRAVLGIVTFAALAGCDDPQPQAPRATAEPPAPVANETDESAELRAEAVATLTAWEQREREAVDFSSRPPWSERSGPDPFALVPHPEGQGWLGLLRGAGTIVAFDDPADTRAVAKTFVDATDWAIDDDALYVVGPRHGAVHRLKLDALGSDKTPGERISIDGAVSLRAIAVGEQRQVAVGDAYTHRVLAAPRLVADQSMWSADCGGPLDLRWTPAHLVALCMLEHRVKVWALDRGGMPHGEPRQLEHDGPVWSMDVRARSQADGEHLRLALGGVEDHPLDRSDGAFGHVDSFVFVVDLPPGQPAKRRTELNVAEHGAVTPKWIELRESDTGTTVTTAGYGGDALVTARWAPGFDDGPTVSSRPLVPGITAVVGNAAEGLAASPLLDAWIAWDATAVRVHSLPDDRPTALRVGEALATTGLIAPHATSEGKRSRFTCETCHFEGGTDGRVHWTGRGQVHASTRSLRGLFENRPHFSRALDLTMATMVDNEFSVGSRGNPGTPWFSVSPDTVGWLRHLGVDEPRDGTTLRRDLMTFLMAYTHEPNPAARALGGPAEAARQTLERGADLFATHCEGCHAARRVADVPDSRIERSQWLSTVLADGALVWGSPERHRTGVEPYVHDDGPRVPSLRRLFTKRPYFTNGSAATVDDVLSGFSPTTQMHVRDADEPALSPEDRESLRSWLQVL